MRERMRELDIRITELCDYLHYSRPTMYRFIENYEAGKYRGIDSGVLKLFRYIEDTPNIGKKNVVSYIINNVAVEDDNETRLVRAVKDYESSKMNNPKKTAFITRIMTTSEIDDIVAYIEGCEEIKDNVLSDEEIGWIGRYILFRDDIAKGKKLTKVQIEKVKGLMEEL